MSCRVDFYVLPENTQREKFVCNLTAKAMHNGHRVYIHAPQQQVAGMLDEMLWTFNDISFIPHAFTGSTAAADSPVLIGAEKELPHGFDVLINLSESMPPDSLQCERMVEIVAGDENMRSKARDRYRDYRSRDYELHSHTIHRV